MRANGRAGVSVVTAVHAPHAPFLTDAWASLREQDHGDWEWLVQVDGPHPAVTAALEKCGAAGDPRVRVAVNGTAEGPAVTRNIALGRSRAPFVQNVDADDALEPGALTALTAVLAADPDVGFAVGRARDLLPSGELRDHVLPLDPGPLPRGSLAARWQTAPGSYRLPVHPAGVLWRRSLLLAVGGWSALRGMEDTGLLMAASAAAPGVLVDADTLRYRKHPGQGSAQVTEFAGGGPQIALIRQRVALLSGLPAWRDPHDPRTAFTPPP
ncbi:glycosyltransferase family 2 protein [Streptomyces sp. NPDC058297]|uniref:glycosyltransferase family 2 protein n=1 Tax=Streptomyces sp. NPDC058297 TaxID=3346433 RepID=UPI0036F02578